MKLIVLCENDKGSDQHVRPRSLISAFVIRSLKCLIDELNTCNKSIVELVSVAEYVGLDFTRSHFVILNSFDNGELTLSIRETPQRVVWQTVKTQMKCSIMLHYCLLRLRSSSDKRLHYFLKL